MLFVYHSKIKDYFVVAIPEDLTYLDVELIGDFFGSNLEPISHVLDKYIWVFRVGVLYNLVGTRLSK